MQKWLQLTPATYGPNSPRGDRLLIKLGQNLRPDSAQLAAKFQLDCSKINEVTALSTKHLFSDGFGSTRLTRFGSKVINMDG